jgi:O-methyltransferase
MTLAKVLGRIVNRSISPLGYKVTRKASGLPEIPIEATEYERRLIDLIQPFSMTGPERKWALMQSLKYVADNSLAGDLVECGVWRGGNLALMRRFANDFFASKLVFGYDTFEGMV